MSKGDNNGYLPSSTKQQQPRAQAGMMVSQPFSPAEGGSSRGALKEREWSYKLFDCFGDYRTCCLSCWCPCIAFSTIQKRYEHLVRNGAPHPTGGGPKCGLSAHCVLYSLMVASWCSTCHLLVPLRSGVRARYDIQGDGSEDCLTAWFCTPCALTQESRELRIEEEQHSVEMV